MDPIVDEAGNKTWCNEAGEIHRDGDLPAVELACGSKMWFANGLRHRKGNPAIELSNGFKLWSKFGKVHREDGPACMSEGEGGSKDWWFNGVRHREDGPAVIYSHGRKEWWLNGKQYTEEGFNNRKNDKKTRRVKVEIEKQNLSKPIGYSILCHSLSLALKEIGCPNVRIDHKGSDEKNEIFSIEVKK